MACCEPGAGRAHWNTAAAVSATWSCKSPPGRGPRSANAGVFFRCRPGLLMEGYEAQVYNGCEEGDPARPARYATGAIDDRQNARRLVSRDLRPFTLTVIAHGPHLATWVDGHQVTDWADARPADDNPPGASRIEPGTIQLQAHDPRDRRRVPLHPGRGVRDAGPADR